MATHQLPYGRGAIDVDLSAVVARGHALEVIAPRAVAPAADPLAEVEAALDPLDWPDLRGRRCAIAINDATRPVPHDVLLPPLLRRLERAGAAPADIHLIVATGTHAPVPPSRLGEIVPRAVLDRHRVDSHDARREEDLAALGTTSRGTPILVNRHYLEADLRLVVGAIEPHQFMGFSGGAKSAAVGLSGAATIAANHSMMVHPLARLGRYEDNPCRQDVEDIGARVGVHLALNVVLDGRKRIVRALAGDPLDVMRRGIPLVRACNQVEVAAPFDLVVVSPGGHPKDVNLYQAQKAIAHATLIARPGATLVVAAACPEGTGSQAYEAWMARADMTSHDAVLRRFAEEGYRIGPHKAFQISRDASRVRVLLHSTLEDAFVARLLLTPAPDLSRALAEAVAALPPAARVAVMPAANATIPVVAASP